MSMKDENETYIHDSYLSMPLEIVFGYLRFGVGVRLFSDFFHDKIVNLSHSLSCPHNEANTLCGSCNIQQYMWSIDRLIDWSIINNMVLLHFNTVMVIMPDTDNTAIE